MTTEVLIDENRKEKVVFDLTIDREKQAKRISSEILKMHDNNQYGTTMTKPLPYGCIKRRDPNSTLAELNLIKFWIKFPTKILPVTFSL